MNQDPYHQPNFGLNIHKLSSHQHQFLLSNQSQKLFHRYSNQTSYQSKPNQKQQHKKQLIHLIDQNKRLLEQRILILQKRNYTLENQNNQLRTLDKNNKLKIQYLENQIEEINANIEKKTSENNKYKQSLVETTTEKLSTNRDDSFITSLNSPEAHSLKLKSHHSYSHHHSYSYSHSNSNSSMEMINSSQESFIKEDVIEQLKYQNNTLQKQIVQNNKKYQMQIEKLNQYIDKLLLKQEQIQGLKTTIATLFQAITKSFVDYSNEKMQYEKKIVEILKEMAGYRDRQAKAKKDMEIIRQNRRVQKEV